MVDAEMVFLDKVGAGVKRNQTKDFVDAIEFLLGPHFVIDGLIA